MGSTSPGPPLKLCIQLPTAHERERHSNRINLLQQVAGETQTVNAQVSVNLVLFTLSGKVPFSYLMGGGG